MSIDRIREFFADPTVIEVLVNSVTALTIVTTERRVVRDSIFSDRAEMVRWLQDFAFAQGIRLDPLKPYSGGFLEEASLRWHCLIPPVAVDGPILSVRRHGFAALALANFQDPCDLLPRVLQLIASGAPLLVCGATASGKTTLLSALLREACTHERVMIIESIIELPLSSRLWVRCQAREQGIGGAGLVKMETLIEEILRLRPDRFVIGEIRGQEIIALIKALTIGHLGMLATLHAESATQALARIKFLLALYSRAACPEQCLRELHFLMLQRGNPPRLQGLHCAAEVICEKT